MNLNNVKYWRNGEQITAQDLNNILVNLSILDNKIVDNPKISNVGVQYSSQLYSVQISDAVYNETSNVTIVPFTPQDNVTVLGILSVSDGITSYSNVSYKVGDDKLYINGIDLSNKTIYVSYYTTSSNVTFSDVILSIDYQNQTQPYVIVLVYESNETFSVYVRGLSQKTKYIDWTKIGNVYFDVDEQTFVLEDTYLSIKLNSIDNIQNKNINIGDVIYFTFLYPENQIFGQSLSVNGNVLVNENVIPISNESTLGLLGEQIFDENTGQYLGVFTKQWKYLVSNNVYTDNILTKSLLFNELGNTTNKKITFNPLTGEIQSENKDFYIKLDEYNQSANTGVKVSTGVHPDNTYTLLLSDLKTNITLQDLEDNNILTENDRIGYFTNISNVGDVIYINKKQIFEYLQSYNNLITFNIKSLEKQKITSQYIDPTSGKTNSISLIINEYLSTTIINNVEYLKYTILNESNISYFQIGSINNISSIIKINFGTFITSLPNLNDDEQNIVVNGIENGNPVLQYKYNESRSLFTLQIIDYQNGEVLLVPQSDDNLNDIFNITQLSYNYNQYKFAVKNDDLLVTSKNGNLVVDSSIHYEKDKVKYPFLTYITSGILTFDGSTDTKEIPIPDTDIDLEVLLTPLHWQQISDTTGEYSLNLYYNKDNEDNINVTFYALQQQTTPSSATVDVNEQLYTQKLTSDRIFNTEYKNTNQMLIPTPDNRMGQYFDNINKLIKFPSTFGYHPENGDSPYVKVNINNKDYLIEIKDINNPTVQDYLPPNFNYDLPVIDNKKWYNYGYGINSIINDTINYSPLFTKYFGSKVFDIKTYSNIAYAISDFFISEFPSLQPTVTIPTQPTDLNGIYDQTNKRIKLTWESHSDNEDGFVIVENNEINNKFTVPKNTGSYFINNIEPNSGKYSFYVYAYNSAGNSVHSNNVVVDTQISVQPYIKQPSNLKVIKVTDDSVTLSWKDNSTNETGFEVTIFGSRNEVITHNYTGKNITSITISNLHSGTVYSQSVKAYIDENNYSDSSNTVSFRTKVPTQKVQWLTANFTGKPTTVENTDYNLDIKVNSSYSNIPYKLRILTITDNYNSTLHESNDFESVIHKNSNITVIPDGYYQYTNIKNGNEILINTKFIDKENKNSQIPFKILIQLYDQVTNTLQDQVTISSTFKGVYIPQPPTPPNPVNGEFTLSCSPTLIGNQYNTIKFHNTWSDAYTLTVQFLKNGYEINKAIKTIKGQEDGEISILVPNSKDNISGIIGKIYTQNTSPGTPNSELIDQYLISWDKFNIQSSIPTILNIKQPSGSTNNKDFNIDYLVKGGGNYRLQFKVSGYISGISSVTLSDYEIDNINQNQSGTITVHPNLHSSLPHQISITQTLINTSTNQVEKTVVKYINITQQLLPYTLQAHAENTTINPGDNIYITIDKQTQPYKQTIRVTQSVWKKEESQSVTFDKMITDKTFSFTPLYQLDGSTVETNTFSIQLIDDKGNIQKQQSLNVTVYSQGSSSDNTITPVNPVVVKPIYPNPDYTINTGYSDVTTPTYFTNMNRSIGQDNTVIDQKLVISNYSYVNTVVFNGNVLSNSNNGKLTETEFDVSDYVKIGRNRVSLKFNRTDNKVYNMANVTLIINGGTYNINNDGFYEVTYDKLQDLNKISTFSYYFDNLDDNSDDKIRGIYNSQVIVKKVTTSIANNKYEYLSPYSVNNPLIVTIPTDQTKVIINYGKTTQDIKSYIHTYKENENTGKIKIWSSQSPSNTTIYSNPFIIYTYIQWDNKHITTLTTSRTKTDIGNYNIYSVDYYIPGTDDKKILIKGTVKYLIIGKTI